VVVCGPDLRRDTDANNAVLCLCGNDDPLHRWYARNAEPELQQFHLSDGLRALEWDHGRLRVVPPESIRPAGGFCGSCTRTTLSQSAGRCYTLNGIGTAIRGSKHRCQTCGSVVATKWITFFYIPLYPLGRFRVIWGSSYEFGYARDKESFYSRYLPPFIEP
jgi:hypothetical protein